MYLTRIELDIKKRKTLRALSIPSLFHGAIEKSFDDYGQRHLWRIDLLCGKYYLLLTSGGIPDMRDFVSQFGAEPYESCVASKEYHRYINRIQTGSRLRFRLTANPTISEPSSYGSARGKVRAHVTPAHQKEWLIKKSCRYGFATESDEFEVTGCRSFHFRKQKNAAAISMLAVSFEGNLTVTEPELFRDALVKGIGREKAYGMGMMTVIGI